MRRQCSLSSESGYDICRASYVPARYKRYSTNYPSQVDKLEPRSDDRASVGCMCRKHKRHQVEASEAPGKLQSLRCHLQQAQPFSRRQTPGRSPVGCLCNIPSRHMEKPLVFIHGPAGPRAIPRMQPMQQARFAVRLPLSLAVADFTNGFFPGSF